MDSLDLAKRVISTFLAQDEVKAAFLNGSLARGTADEFSDIDIIVDVSGSDNGMYLERVVALIEQDFGVRFHYYACHRVPDIYVVCLFLRDASVFQIVDVQCVATPHCRSVSRDDLRRIRDDVAGLLKGWVKHAVLILRGVEDAPSKIREYIQPRIGDAYEASLPPERLLALLLDEIQLRAGTRHHDFIGECRKLLEARLGG